MPNPLQTIATEITGTLVTSITALSASVAGILAGPALLGLTIYIIWMGYLTLMGKVDTPVPTLTMKLVKVSLIVFFAIGAGIYQSLIVPAVNGAEEAIVGALSGVGASSIPDQIWRTTSRLDTYLTTLGAAREPPTVGSGSFSMPLPDIEYGLFQAVVNIGHFLLVILAMVPYLVAKVTLGILLALGPLFIILLIWPATARFFESWLSAVVAAILTFAILAATIGFIVPVVDSVMASIPSGITNLWSIAAALVPTYLILGWIAWTAGSIAGQLAGGGGSGNPLGSLVGAGVHHALGTVFRKSRGNAGGNSGGRVGNSSPGGGRAGGQGGNSPQSSRGR